MRGGEEVDDESKDKDQEEHIIVCSLGACISNSSLSCTYVMIP